MENKTLAAHIADFISDKNIPAVFQLSGGMIAFIIDAISKLESVQVINNRHEQASGFAAEGLARVTGSPSVAFGTSGPGATNLITAIASCYYDSTPVLFITGQVAQNEIRKDKNQRQLGFQELNIADLSRHITKKVYEPMTAIAVMRALEDGWNLTLQGRRGPVLIDIPINLQQEVFSYKRKLMKSTPEVANSGEFPTLQVQKLLDKASYPLILAGGGIRSSDSTAEFRSLVENSGIPFVASLMGLDAIDQKSPNFLGFIGSYGNRWANKSLEICDLLIVFGSRLDIRQTGADINQFTSNKKIIRIDIDSFELKGRIKADVRIRMGLLKALEHFKTLNYKKSYSELKDKVLAVKKQYPQHLEQTNELVNNPNQIMQLISEKFKNVSGYVVDVGQHQMWAAQSLELHGNQRFITSGGMGAMGFALPASIGAAIATKSRWVVIIGDGCLQLSAAEMQTISHYNLPITICLMNNEQHGMVAQFQEKNLDGRLIGTREGYSNPDFQTLAKAFGFKKTFKFYNSSDIANLEIFLSQSGTEPIFIELMIDHKAQALPKKA